MATSFTSLSQPQRLPSNWSHILGETSVLTERDLRYKPWMGEGYWSRNALGIDTKALTFVVMQALDRTSSSPPTLKGGPGGSFNEIYTATFESGSTPEENQTIIIRLPVRKNRIPGRIETTAALMTYTREYLKLPVPKVYAWNDSDGNPVKSPYIIMEYAPGTNSHPVWFETPDRQHWDKMLDSFAGSYVQLAKPLPWSRYGSIYFAKGEAACDLTDIEAYQLGPFMPGPMATSIRKNMCPYQVVDDLSLVRFWTMMWETEVSYVETRQSGIYASVLRAEEGDVNTAAILRLTFSDFLATANQLLEFIRLCPLPSDPSLYEPCIVPMDYAMRNINIGASTFEITSYLDWDDCAILPFILCSRYIEEIADDPGDDKEWLEKGGGFIFLPEPEKEKYVGETEDVLSELQWKGNGQSGTSLRAEVPSIDKPITGTIVEGGEGGVKAPNEGAVKEVEDQLDDEDFDFGGDEVLRKWRVINSHFRHEYMQLLEQYDERYAIPGFWEAREDALKIHHLLVCGWTEWMAKSDWIMGRLEKLTQARDAD